MFSTQPPFRDAGRCLWFDERVRLMAHAWLPEYQKLVYVEIVDTDAASQTAEVHIPGRQNLHVFFHQLSDVALTQGGKTLEFFGTPHTGRDPAWTKYPVEVSG